jgi:hypothetical protein
MTRSLILAVYAAVGACRARLLCATAAVVLAGFGTAPARTYKMSTPIASGVAVPDRVESSIGTLNLDTGYQSADTVDRIYDSLDRSRTPGLSTRDSDRQTGDLPPRSESEGYDPRRLVPAHAGAHRRP